MTANHEHTPTTARIKDDYRRSRVWESGNGSEAYEKEFDRWHAAEIAAAEQRGAIKALRDAASSGLFVGPIADLLENRADLLEGDDD